jgi:hypothetical protein
MPASATSERVQKLFEGSDLKIYKAAGHGTLSGFPGFLGSSSNHRPLQDSRARVPRGYLGALQCLSCSNDVVLISRVVRLKHFCNYVCDLSRALDALKRRVGDAFSSNFVVYVLVKLRLPALCFSFGRPKSMCQLPCHTSRTI